MRIQVLTDGCEPSKANQDDAGWDLRAADHGVINPGQWTPVATGIKVAVAPGQAAFIKPRSGLAVRHGIDVLAGVIDAGYRGEVAAVLINHGDTVFTYEKFDRIAQLVVMHIDTSDAVVVESLEETDRGDLGFGSSGNS